MEEKKYKKFKEYHAPVRYQGMKRMKDALTLISLMGKDLSRRFCLSASTTKICWTLIIQPLCLLSLAGHIFGSGISNAGIQSLSLPEDMSM